MLASNGISCPWCTSGGVRLGWVQFESALLLPKLGFRLGCKIAFVDCTKLATHYCLTGAAILRAAGIVGSVLVLEREINPLVGTPLPRSPSDLTSFQQNRKTY